MSADLRGANGFAHPDEAVEFASNLLAAATEYSIIGLDLAGTLVLWNEGARRLYGYDSHEVLGKQESLLHAARSNERSREMTEAALREGCWRGEVERRRKDGSEFIARVVLTPRRDSAAMVNGFLLMSSDVSVEVGLREELEQAASRGRELFEFAPDAIVGVDERGLIQVANSRVEAMFGYERTELIGEPVEVLVPERFRGAHLGHRNGYMRSPRTRPMGAGLDLYALRKDGSEFPCEISLSATRERLGVVAVAAVRDISDRKRDQLALQHANAELERASRAKDSFLASMSHELRTPLNAILGFAGTLLMELPGKLNDDQRKQLQTVQSNGKHLLSLINDILDVAKIESGKVEVHPEPVDANGVAEEVIGSLAPLAEEKALALDAEVPREPLIVETDRRALSQILINLVNNSIKFTDSGAVKLALDRPDGLRARFRVIDSGQGISESDQERLFEAFEQSASSAAEQKGGTGLGLYISSSLAELIGARIGIESEPGEGTTFTLELGGRS